MEFSMILLLIVFIIIVLLALIQIVMVLRQLPFKNIPGPKPLPIFGNSLEFDCQPTDLFKKLIYFNKTYGKIHTVSIGVKQFILISDAEFIEMLLSSQVLIDKSDDYHLLYKWLGTGLLTSTGAKWKTRRRIITPAFHFKILENFIDVFNSSTAIFVGKLKEKSNGGSFDVYPYITLHALDIICETAMGTSINAQENSESNYVQAVRKMCHIIFLRLFSSWKQFDSLFKFSSDYVPFIKAIDTLHEMTNSVIKNRRQLLMQSPKHNETENENSSVYFGQKKKRAFLDILLEAYVDGKPLSDADIREEVDTFMFEGHDTVSSAIAFAFYCLSKNPQEQEKIFKEQYDIFGNEKDKPVTYNDLQDMKYLELFIKEVLRLYPSVPFIGRVLNEDVKFNGDLYPKGTTVVLQIFMMHRNEEYFPNADEFQPERFLSSNIEKNPFMYVPFSAGPRNCIGQKFAMMELKSTLSSVIRNFEVLPSDSNMELMSSIILKSSNGVKIKLNNRQYIK